MAFRYARSSNAQAILPRLVELEGRISVLMAETEGRAKHISEQLARREQHLSRSIADVEERERSMGQTLRDGEDLTKELALLCEGARREAVDLERAVAESRVAQEAFAAAQRQANLQKQASLKENEQRRQSRADESAKEAFSPQRMAALSDSRRASEWMDDIISGREAHQEPQRETRSNKKQSVNSLQESFRAAEQMLKRGQDAEEVSEQTNLPIEGVKRLAQMIEIERIDRGDDDARSYSTGRSARDPRLGALGLSRRPSQTTY